MYAKSLEGVLQRLLKGADFSWPDAEDLAKRFDTLRGSALLPIGRENRAQRLSAEQIANAVLSLTAPAPSFAALAAGALARLRPVGDLDPTLLREPTLHALLARLISDADARTRLVTLRLSVSENGVNSNGGARVIYDAGQQRGSTSYVSELATSALYAGPDAYDAEQRYAAVSRDLVLNQRFFSKLSREIEDSLLFDTPAGDGSEYDAHDAAKARMIKLQYRTTARFLNMSVDTHAAWPREETLVIFDGVRLVLMPPTKSTSTSIHVDLSGNRITSEDAQTVIQRFLSVLAWEDDQYAVLGHGWSGNPVPVPVPRSVPVFATAHQWFGPRRSAGQDKANRALAHYRAGCNALHAGLVTYGVLSFYKVLEVQFRQDDRMAKWIARALPALRTEPGSQDLWARFDTACGAEAPEAYIKSAYRLAAAHASTKTPSDEDEAGELSRLDTGAGVLRALARELMREKLGVDALLQAPAP